MAAKVWAVCFVCLIALPFTAPFSTFTVADSGFRVPVRSGPATVAPQPSTPHEDVDIEDAIASTDRSALTLSRAAGALGTLVHVPTVPSVYSRLSSAPAALAAAEFCPLASVLRL